MYKLFNTVVILTILQHASKAHAINQATPRTYLQLNPLDVKELRNQGYFPLVSLSQHAQTPSAFRPTPATVDSNVLASYQRRNQYEPENYPIANSKAPLVGLKKIPPQYKDYREQNEKANQNVQSLEKEEEEEIEEPDRLTLLLPNSKFDCTGKGPGYYADEDLNCEVFHYCQDNAKHSWICPNGFTFHQIHLICMPPSHDNICTKSSQFHFINDYLYKPLNVEEVEQRPNATLRYADRYYPNLQTDETVVQHRQPIQVGLPQETQQSDSHRRQPQQQYYPIPQYRAEAPKKVNQVFHSPEEVNISLQQRRPYSSNQRLYNNRPIKQQNDYE